MSDEKEKKEEKEETISEEAESTEKKVEQAEEVAVAAAEEIEEVKESAEQAKEEVVEIKEKPKQEEKSVPAEATTEKPTPSGKYKELIEQIEKLSVLELSELVKDLEARFGVSAAAPIAIAGVGAPTTGGAGEVEEKTSYDVVLASSGDKKIQVIKAVREIKPDLGLKEAKDLVESAPKDLAKGMKKEEAEEAKKKLEEAGATVELK